MPAFLSPTVPPRSLPLAHAALGSPAEAGERLLSSTIAPPGSGRTALLLAAGERDAAGNLYYSLEFVVSGSTRDGAVFQRRNFSVLAASGEVLFTLTCQAPDTEWPKYASAFAAAAKSFKLTNA